MRLRGGARRARRARRSRLGAACERRRRLRQPDDLEARRCGRGSSRARRRKDQGGKVALEFLLLSGRAPAPGLSELVSRARGGGGPDRPRGRMPVLLAHVGESRHAPARRRAVLQRPQDRRRRAHLLRRSGVLACGVPRRAGLRLVRRAPPRPRRVTETRLQTLLRGESPLENDGDEVTKVAFFRRRSDDGTAGTETRREETVRGSGSPPLVRAVATLVGVGSAGLLIWLAQT